MVELRSAPIVSRTVRETRSPPSAAKPSKAALVCLDYMKMIFSIILKCLFVYNVAGSCGAAVPPY